jgi:hypothetical protein
MLLFEIFDEYDEEDENKYEHLKPSSVIQAAFPEIVAAAQSVYDWWDQGEEDELNGGGICHLIADKVCNLLYSKDIVCTTVSSTHEFHVYVVAQCSDGVFKIDIPYRLYEHGGGFTWTKIPDVTFSTSDIVLYCLSHDPSKMKEYVDEWEE